MRSSIKNYRCIWYKDKYNRKKKILFDIGIGSGGNSKLISNIYGIKLKLDPSYYKVWKGFATNSANTNLTQSFGIEVVGTIESSLKNQEFIWVAFIDMDAHLPTRVRLHLYRLSLFLTSIWSVKSYATQYTSYIRWKRYHHITVGVYDSTCLLALHRCHPSNTTIWFGGVVDDIIEKVPHQTPGTGAKGLLAEDYVRNKKYINKGFGGYPPYIFKWTMRQCLRLAHDFMPLAVPSGLLL